MTHTHQASWSQTAGFLAGGVKLCSIYVFNRKNWIDPAGDLNTLRSFWGNSMIFPVTYTCYYTRSYNIHIYILHIYVIYIYIYVIYM